jgi:hypothetical protein
MTVIRRSGVSVFDLPPKFLFFQIMAYVIVGTGIYVATHINSTIGVAMILSVIIPLFAFIATFTGSTKRFNELSPTDKTLGDYRKWEKIFK